MAKKPETLTKEREAVNKQAAPVAGKVEGKPQRTGAQAPVANKRVQAASKKAPAVEKRAKPPKEKKEKKELKIVRYFREVKAELRMVIWSTREEATKLTLIVLAVTASMSVFLGLIDWLLTQLFSWIVS